MRPEFDEATIRQLVTDQVEAMVGKPVKENDDLFDLGLTSMDATRLITWIDETFGTTVSLRAVFEGPEIGLLVTAIAQPPAAGEQI
ncbi:acyl carrier protein [Streptomyces sp. NPDC053253]|uniref:acyl carrier protein n=1 Tax=Streptomyces sp. NPDC053253 TaxID=3365699 RepID=UPI0037D37A73